MSSDATYASRLLTDGYGFQDQEAAVEFLGEIDGVEVEWTLGALLDSILKHKGGGSSGGGEPSSTSHGHHSSSLSAAMAEDEAATHPQLLMPALVIGGALLVVLLRKFVCKANMQGSPRMGAMRMSQSTPEPV